MDMPELLEIDTDDTLTIGPPLCSNLHFNWVASRSRLSTIARWKVRD
jgi:hypothetical protein